MENLPLGPLPVLRRQDLTRAAASLLDTLEGDPRWWSLAELADATGLHVNTLREQLQQLAADGLIARDTARPTGRGRPRMLFRAEAGATSADPVSEYAGLATALAAALLRTSDRPAQDAATAGTAWGRDLARASATSTSGASPTGERDARAQVTAVLDGMGFAPRADADHVTVRLTRCPLLDAARRHPEVVCAVHLGIAEGALAELQADDSGVSLLPFAEPGACVLRLAETEAR